MNDEIVKIGLMEDFDIALDEAALALAALDNPQADLAPYRALLASMTAQLGEHRDGAPSARDQAAALAVVIAGEHGFRGDTETYDDPANADLIAVMERRRGLPVALSIIYVALARRVGWTAFALNTPGHLLVRIGTPPATVIIDPFNGGVLVERSALAQLLARGGAGASTRPEDVAPLSNQATLARLLLNQATRAQNADQPERALTVYQRLTTVAPLITGLWWSRAELEQQLGQIAAARASLHAALETTRDQRLRNTIHATLERLARSTH
jgi:regulator of sirC expression with transglutaminase-like and TPR domain